MESIFNISGCAIENQNGQIRTLGPEAYAMTWEKKMTDKYCPHREVKKIEIELWNLKVKGNDVPTYTNRFQELTLICTKFVANENEKINKYISGLPYSIYGNIRSSKRRTLDETIELTNDLMDQKLRTYAERSGNKRKADDTSRSNHGHQQQPFKKQNVTKKNENAPMNPDSNVVTGTFLLNNRYASILFDTGVDKSFISTAFSSLVNIDPTPLGSSYDVELADGKTVKIDTIIRGCTLNFLNHPFNIDLMPTELGSFDVIIGMDWLRKYHAIIVCDKKLVHVPYGNETLIFHGNKNDNRRESRLTVISCSKAQEYMTKGCQIFLAHISAKKGEDKPGGKQLKDVPIVWDFSEVFPEDLPGLPLARPVEFQIDLIPEATPGEKEHEEHLKAILELLKVEKLYAKFSKCEFWIPKVQFLGHVIDSRGIHVDPAKIESIKYWASPKTPTEIHQFLGLAGYYRRGWVKHLPLVEFSYNNSYHASIKVTPYEALYDRKCRSPVCWAEVGEAQLTGPEMIQKTTEKIILIKQRIQAAQNRQKSYADRKRKPMKFEVRDRVMLKVSP
nr:reverse transcriptase domain-containing protein [Tanacetum cinerariifolium]